MAYWPRLLLHFSLQCTTLSNCRDTQPSQLSTDWLVAELAQLSESVHRPLTPLFNGTLVS